MDVPLPFGFSLSLTWLLILLVLFVFLSYDTWMHGHWKRRGVPYEPAWPVIANIPAFALGLPKVFHVLREKHGKVFGMFSSQKPALVVTDPDLLKHLMVKNFSQFHDRPMFPQNNVEMRAGLPNLEGERWREVRNLLTPTFSRSKMVQMSELVNRSADRLVDHMGHVQKERGNIECRELFGAFVMDTIGSCGFGLDIDSQTNPDDPFVANAKRTFKFNTASFLFLLSSIFPPIGKFFAYFNIGLFFPVDVMKFFHDVTMKAVDLRKGGSGESSRRYLDFLQLMVDAQKSVGDKRNADEDENDDENDVHAELDRHHDVGYHKKNLGKNIQLTDHELIGQAVTFFTAGYETTNTLLGFICYLLATEPECQERLVREVDETTPSRDSVGYSSIASMQYLDQIVCETLRIYPPATILSRKCTESFEYKDFTIDKGVVIMIPIDCIHHDPDYWPEPAKFDPERFSKANRKTHHPFAWLPFGAGPHNCIGMRFALMETKMAVVRVLQKFRLETCPETEIPPKLGTNGFLSPPNGFTLRAVPRRTDVVG